MPNGIEEVEVRLTAGGGVTISKLVAELEIPGKKTIKWIGIDCRIKIEPDHPEHFSQLLPPSCAPVVIGILADDAPAGTYHYCIDIKGPDEDLDDELKRKLAEIDPKYPTDARVAKVYRVDPDYKVER